MTSNRVALYYPEIDIPNHDFIRKAILYWDKVGSIVPKKMWDNIYFEDDNSEFYQLIEEDIYQPFFIKRNTKEKFIFEEFFERLKFLEERNQIKPFSIGKNSKLMLKENNYHQDIFNELEKRKLAIYTRFEENEFANLKQRIISRYKISEGHIVESHVALLFMSILAEYIAYDDSNNITIPVTTDQLYQDYAYCGYDENLDQKCAQLILGNILPMPDKNISIEELLNFKKDHKSELIRFRKSMNEFQTNIQKISNNREITDFCIIFLEDIEENVSYIKDHLAIKKYEGILGSVEILLDCDGSKFFQSLSAIGLVGGIATGNPYITAVSMGFGAIVQVGSYHIKKKKECFDYLREQPYSYIYHLKEDYYLPKKNINNPFESISNRSICRYDNPDEDYGYKFPILL